MRASVAVKLVFLQKPLAFDDKLVFLRLFDLAVLLCVIQVAVVQAQRKEEKEKEAAVEVEALNQEESEQPQAMDTVDGSLHEDIPSNPSEELNAVNDHKELGPESWNDESISKSEGNGLLLDASKEGQGAETDENLAQLDLENAHTELGAS
jgi:hypothetical protein